MDIKRSEKSKLKSRIRTGILVGTGLTVLGGITYWSHQVKTGGAYT